MKGPRLGPRGDINWPNQVTAGAEERLVSAKSNLTPQNSKNDKAHSFYPQIHAMRD